MHRSNAVIRSGMWLALCWTAACGSPTPAGGAFFGGDGSGVLADGVANEGDGLPSRDATVTTPDAATPDALPDWLFDADGGSIEDDTAIAAPDNGALVGDDQADGTAAAGDVGQQSDGSAPVDAVDLDADGDDANDAAGGDAADSGTAEPDTAPPPECTDGVCCDVAAGAFVAAGTPCGAAKPEQWKCSGQKLQSRSVQGGCSGSDAACTGADILGSWKTQQTCSSSEKCDASPPKCKAITPDQLSPCQQGQCWQSKIPLPAACGSSVKTENFGSGKYNVHRYILNTTAKVTTDLSLATTAGSFEPALIIQDASGKTLFDGQYGTSNSSVEVKAMSAAKTAGPAKVRITTQSAVQLYVFVTGWAAIDSGFSKGLPTTIKYALTITLDCAPPATGKLQSPPCFDPKNVKGGYYLLPQSCPSGLYTRKADDCSRGTKRLIDVLYTVSARAKKELPAYSPLHFNDLNEGSCSVVDHLTHDDGTHADVHSGCATNVSCADNGPAIALAKMFIDTGEACGILFNDTGVQAVVNAYFASKVSYKPWGSKFMRSVTGHNTHFHVRVKKPDGSCN
jgi:hypothetical protein